MKQFLVYVFWPNPGNVYYGSPKVIALLILCAVLLCASLVLRVWRVRQKNPVARKLSRSWASALMWFGGTGMVLVVARVEMIQYLAMRFLWLAWAIIAILYVLAQFRKYRMRYYEVLPSHSYNDPREKYLPGRKRR